VAACCSLSAPSPLESSDVGVWGQALKRKTKSQHARSDVRESSRALTPTSAKRTTQRADAIFQAMCKENNGQVELDECGIVEVGYAWLSAVVKG